MTHPNRIDGVGRIKRGKALRFYFNGKQYFGFQGDTLASALLANDVHLVGRSFKYHRPRGILSAGPEEPNAIVQLEQGAYTEPNTRATQIELYDNLVAHSQNCWPSVKFDVGAVNSFFSRFMPAGFYYKTFMWPASMWMTYEHFIRKAAGLGRSPRMQDPDTYEQVNAHCDVLIAGAGAAGLSAALAAGASGARVILMDEQSEPGGYLLTDPSEIDGVPSTQWVQATCEALAAMDNVRVMSRCTVTGYYDYNYLTALQRVSDHLGPKHDTARVGPRQKFWKIRAKQVVLAAGAIEKPMLFADNDRPGIMLASSVRTYVNRYCVLPGKNICVFTNNDNAYSVALDCHAAGAEVTVVDIRPKAEGPLVQATRKKGIPIHTGSGITAVHGKKAVKGVSIQKLNKDGSEVVGASYRIDCEVVASSGGLNPTVHLHSQARGSLVFKEELGSFIPDRVSPLNSSRSAGACNGTFGLGSCLQEGVEAGKAAAADAGFESVEVLKAGVAENLVTEEAWYLSVVPSDPPVGMGPAKHFHDMQNDVTVADIHLAAREGYLSVEHLKRYTTTGMGTDQGKTSNISALSVMAQIRGLSIPEVGTTTFRPPYTPVTFGAIAGQYTDDLFLQARHTPMHQWHELNGAVFEDVGDWKRARYYPRPGADGLEDMHTAVQRESLQTRQSVGMVDASTLGKIDIQGKDSAKFLNMVYTNAWLKLENGQCRYGLMLNEHGMVFDDGVTTRIADNHYHMTTTTGGAARVMNWLEEWLQTEWPDLDVYCNSVTEQWAVMAINGPRATELLSELADLDLSDAAFPHMSFREGSVAGIKARIFRISFTGELSYEINVPARYGLHLWESLVTAGEKYDLCVYGTETMHVLRAEKGFIIVGQDTDGTVTPYDLGMSWIVNTKKPDFLGKRSLARSDTSAAGRKQLVGLLTDDPHVVLPEGAHVVAQPLAKPPMKTEGHVTSSYMSPNANRSIAMGMISNGHERLGESVSIALMDGTFVRATLVKPLFYPLPEVAENA